MLRLSWNEALFPSLRSTVFTPAEVQEALGGFGVDMSVVTRAVPSGPYTGKGSSHACIACAGLAFRVCLERNGHHDKQALAEMICELRYAQMASDAGVGLPSPFFGIVRLSPTDERLISCWPLGTALVVPRTDADGAWAGLRTKLHAALVRLSTRLVALDACKPANWVTIDGELMPIDFETHLCFPTQTDAQRAAARAFVPVSLAMFEMCTRFRFAAGVVEAVEAAEAAESSESSEPGEPGESSESSEPGESRAEALPMTVEALAAKLHRAMSGLLDAYGGRYESFSRVRYDGCTVAYGVLVILMKYAEFALYREDNAAPTVAMLVRMRGAFEASGHVHHAYALGILSPDTKYLNRAVSSSAPSVGGLLAPFAQLLSSLVVGACDRPSRADAIKTFHSGLCAVWRPNERGTKRKLSDRG
jgi:hypothetical protein